MDDWVHHVNQQVRDPAWRAGRMWLIDTRLIADDTEISLADIHRVASRYDGAQINRRVAFVAGKVFPIGEAFADVMSRCGYTVIVFNDIGTACTWLGIGPDEAVTIVRELHAETPAAE